MTTPNSIQQETNEPTIAIAGAGIVGLVLALALEKHVGVRAELYEKAPAFQDDVGAAMGLYPNGLRIIRDISPSLLSAVKEAGHPYLCRRFMRHDGTEVAVAEETALSGNCNELQSIGIRRWRLQKVLYNAVRDVGITVHFGKAIAKVLRSDEGGVEFSFEDGTRSFANILFGVDGARSKVREIVSGKESKLSYTGVTCLMGMADWARPHRGICFPSACTTKCHACFFPTKEKEQCFQFHFPIPEAETGSWRPLTHEEGIEECSKLSDRLIEDGWDKNFVEPLSRVTNVVRIGFCVLEPSLQRWVYGPVALVGDAAHPPIPYIGQGAQMGLEDAGVIALLLKNLCLTQNGSFSVHNFDEAMKVYEQIRIPRTAKNLEVSIAAGKAQQRRADSKALNIIWEASIRFQIFFHSTLPAMFPGVRYDYKEETERAVRMMEDSPISPTKTVPTNEIPPITNSVVVP